MLIIILVCDWSTPTDRDDYYECNDGTFCEGKSCCRDHGDKARCSKNKPIMCAEKKCAGGTDYCCARSSDDCHKGAGGPRLCGIYSTL